MKKYFEPNAEFIVYKSLDVITVSAGVEVESDPNDPFVYAPKGWIIEF